MKSVKDMPVNYSFPFRSCSFHASGPEWPQKTQHTRLQEVLVFLLMIPLLFFFFSHTLSLRTFPPSALLSARKLSLLVSLTQNANLISKLWTIEKLLFLRPQDWLKRKSWISLSSCFFFQSHSICGRDRCKDSSKICRLCTSAFLCLHRTQKTSVLNVTLQLLLIWHGRKIWKGWLLICSFILFIIN